MFRVISIGWHYDQNFYQRTVGVIWTAWSQPVCTVYAESIRINTITYVGILIEVYMSISELRPFLSIGTSAIYFVRSNMHCPT